MKTKLDIILINNKLTIFEQEVPQELLIPFKFLFLKNRFLFKNVLQENKELADGLLKDKDIPAEQSDAYLLSIPEFQEFLKEEVDIKFYTMPISKLEDQNFDSKVGNFLIQNNFITE